VVPYHLRRAYPADASLFLALIALLINEAVFPAEGDSFDTYSLVLSVVALTAAVLLLVGFLGDSRRATYEGAWLSMGVWTAEVVDTVYRGDPSSAMWWFLTLISISMVNLSAGVWWYVRWTTETGEDGDPQS
jgi:hypothetical protein